MQQQQQESIMEIPKTTYVNMCGHCKKLSPKNQPLPHCKRCSNVWYCDRDCQRADWNKHINVCASFSKPIVNALEAAAEQATFMLQQLIRGRLAAMDTVAKMALFAARLASTKEDGIAVLSYNCDVARANHWLSRADSVEIDAFIILTIENNCNQVAPRLNDAPDADEMVLVFADKDSFTGPSGNPSFKEQTLALLKHLGNRREGVFFSHMAICTIVSVYPNPRPIAMYMVIGNKLAPE